VVVVVVVVQLQEREPLYQQHFPLVPRFQVVVVVVVAVIVVVAVQQQEREPLHLLHFPFVLVDQVVVVVVVVFVVVVFVVVVVTIELVLLDSAHCSLVEFESIFSLVPLDVLQDLFLVDADDRYMSHHSVGKQKVAGQNTCSLKTHTRTCILLLKSTTTINIASL